MESDASLIGCKVGMTFGLQNKSFKQAIQTGCGFSFEDQALNA
jgi:hypothetical protein